MPYDIVEKEGEYCLQKQGESGVVKGSCHADKGETMRMMKAMMAQENMETTLIKDEFVATQPGEPYRLFKFGKLVKNGITRVITPEFASRFKLPHFKPAIKLGSHNDPTPAGGHIIGLEVRADGLYAVPEWNDAGSKAVGEGAYRYHSPEVIWEDGALENPQDGSLISGPLVIGDALLHMPHLGEAAAMYEIEIQPMEEPMEDQTTIPSPIKELWEKFVASLAPVKAEPERIEVIPDEYKAAVQERDELKARIEASEKEAQHKALVDKFDAELKETKADPALAELLANVPAETAEAIMKQFKALSEQVKESELTGEKGVEGEQASRDPKAEFNAATLALAAEKGIKYNAAFEQVKADKPDLFAEAFKK